MDMRPKARRSKIGVQPSGTVLQIRNSEAGRQSFGLRWQSAAATPLSECGPASESGVALRFPPQSKSASVMRNNLRIRGPENSVLGSTGRPSQNNSRQQTHTINLKYENSTRHHSSSFASCGLLYQSTTQSNMGI
jgi:hypothetical protein